MKYIICLLFLSSSMLVADSLGQFCPNTKIEGTTRRGTMSNDNFNKCFDSDIECQSELSQNSRAVNILEIGSKDSISNEELISHFTSFSENTEITLMEEKGSLKEIINSEGESNLELMCIYEAVGDNAGSLVFEGFSYSQEDLDNPEEHVYKENKFYKLDVRNPNNTLLLEHKYSSKEYSSKQDRRISSFDEGKARLTYTFGAGEDPKQYIIDLKKLSFSETYAPDGKTSSLKNVSIDNVLTIKQTQKEDMIFNFSLEDTCSTVGECEERNNSNSGCLGEAPRDLVRNGAIIGDIRLCAKGIEVRKNVLAADGTLFKERI